MHAFKHHKFIKHGHGNQNRKTTRLLSKMESFAYITMWIIIHACVLAYERYGFGCNKQTIFQTASNENGSNGIARHGMAWLGL